MQISKPWNSHAGLAPEASNIPNEIQVLNWGLIWSLYYSSDEQIIEMITEIKFAIINLLIHSWEERLTCFDCKHNVETKDICDMKAGYKTRELLSFKKHKMIMV